MVLPSNLFSHSNNEQKRRASAPQSFFDFRQMKIASLGFSHSEAPGKPLCHNQIFTSGSELLKKVADVLLTQKGKVNERYAVLLNPDLVFIRKLKPKKNRNESIFYFTHSLSWCSKIACVTNAITAWSFGTPDITFSSETSLKCIWLRTWKSTWWFWRKTKEKFLPRHRKPLSDLVYTGSYREWTIQYTYSCSPLLSENTDNYHSSAKEIEFSRKRN